MATNLQRPENHTLTILQNHILTSLQNSRPCTGPPMRALEDTVLFPQAEHLPFQTKLMICLPVKRGHNLTARAQQPTEGEAKGG